jgi:molybdate transport system ATP-binding protein
MYRKSDMSFPTTDLAVRNLKPLSQVVPSDPSALHVHLSKSHVSSRSKFHLETTFSVVPGVTVIIGHSGAGKSTILRCLAGLCDPDEGRIAIGDLVLFDSKRGINVEAARRRVAFVFQDLALFPHLSVRDNVTYGLRRLHKTERERRTGDILESFQIEHLSKRLPREISGGEQQRVALARSLVTEPVALLLDEPLSSLDPRTKVSIIEDLHRWNDARRIPIVYVTHDHAEVLALGDRVIALERGLIVTEGLPQEVMPSLRREPAPQPAGFENLFDATVIELRELEQTMVCQVVGTSIRIEIPFSGVPTGAEVSIGIRSAEILVSASQPEMGGSCTVIRGTLKSCDRNGATIKARVGGAIDFRVQLPARSFDSLGLKPSSQVWMIIRAQACRLVRIDRYSSLQRLFVFVCSGNTSRSPMAQAICNAEIARRLRVPLESLERLGIKAVSAGLNARPGEPLTEEAGAALAAIGMQGVEHRSGNLTHRLAQKAEAIFCMTQAQRDELMAKFPEAAAKIHCLQPPGDIDDPTGKGGAAFLELAGLLQRAVSERLSTLGVMEAA